MEESRNEDKKGIRTKERLERLPVKLLFIFAEIWI